MDPYQSAKKYGAHIGLGESWFCRERTSTGGGGNEGEGDHWLGAVFILALIAFFALGGCR